MAAVKMAEDGAFDVVAAGGARDCVENSSLGDDGDLATVHPDVDHQPRDDAGRVQAGAGGSRLGRLHQHDRLVTVQCAQRRCETLPGEPTRAGGHGGHDLKTAPSAPGESGQPAANRV